LDTYSPSKGLLTIYDWIKSISKNPPEDYTDISNLSDKSQYLKKNTGVYKQFIDNQKFIIEMDPDIKDAINAITGTRFGGDMNEAAKYMLHYHLLDKAEEIDDFVIRTGGDIATLEKAVLDNFNRDDIVVFCGKGDKFLQTPLMEKLLENNPDLKIATDIYIEHILLTIKRQRISMI